MHLLAAQPGAITDGEEAVDLGQSPGDIVYISAADTELALIADTCGDMTNEGVDIPSVRLANFMQLGHNMSVDLYIDDIVQHAKLVVARVLGGAGYWPYGVEQLAAICRQKNIMLAVLPGDDRPDPELMEYSTLPVEVQHRLWQYGVHGGPTNTRHLVSYMASLINDNDDWLEPVPLVRAGAYWPNCDSVTLDDIRGHWQDDQQIAAVVFYRALVQSGNLRAVDTLIAALRDVGMNPLPIFAQSLKDPVSAETVSGLLEQATPGVILNATGFAVSAPGAARSETPFDQVGCPVLQVVFSGGNRESWESGTRGLSARDIAMNVALPEVDGRIFTRAVSFKGSARRDDATQSDIVSYEPVQDRMAFVAELAKNWAALAAKSKSERRLAVVLANYPNKDARMGNGVGLDTPAGVMQVLAALDANGYAIDDAPETGAALIDRLKAGPTNDFSVLESRDIPETLSLKDYESWFEGLPPSVRDQVIERWGTPTADPFFLDGPRAFAIPAYRIGNVAICLQSARGYNIDPVQSYHDPALVPPHGYLAFYAWVRQSFGADAICHMGKHGNLEWLPGKALALSENCFSEAALGPVPHIYPFIVNDPGEGTQAKRRAAAVIIDHLTPPLARAESYGPLKDLEQLVDEYYEAAGVDPRRLRVLSEDILSLCRTSGLDQDIGISIDESEEDALAKLDGYLCELKELQIRDGLHVFGQSPIDDLLAELLVALVRVPRGKGEGADASLHRALANDFDLAFDPLDCDMAAPWAGPFPEIMKTLSQDNWRSTGDTVERLELLASALVRGDIEARGWPETETVLAYLNDELRRKVMASGDAELGGFLSALDGKFVDPGPSGAPTRGRLDVLPTGRNFYSVDTRTVPTPAAWTLGWKSAELLVERYRQDNGEWPQTMALSAWGTSNMRTGGDDIAQALALLGVRPQWDSASRRVTGFEILPTDLMDRPRVDVTLRISGFFRDAFPGLIDLFDSAVRAVAALDEPEDLNPLAARVEDERASLAAEGLDDKQALHRAGYRVFGSKPGAYGAGLQAMIDEKGWDTEKDLAQAYVEWGGYAYGGGSDGLAEKGLFRRRLGTVQAVIHNQDNREHDLLDSDDYYQFEGGLTAAVRVESGEQPRVYHNDHSRPERPVVRALDDEIARIIRARVVNPKWISGVMRHGYKGAFEMAATVDYLFAFAATAGCVKDHHFDMVFQAFLDDDEVRDFLKENNPDALRDIADRLKEAQDRGLWTPRINVTREVLDQLTDRV